MSEFTTALRDEFATHFPTMDFSEVKSGYNVIESMLVEELRKGTIFTPDQWEAIVDWKFNGLFQHGTPHISWNTDRADICCFLTRQMNPCRTWTETWYNVEVYSIRHGDVILEVKREEPRIWGQGQTHYYLKITETFTPVPTHRAVIIKLGEDTRAYVAKEFAGSYEACENWVAETVKEIGGYFKIIPIPVK